MARISIANHNLRGTLGIPLIPTALGNDSPEILGHGWIGDERISLDARVGDISLEENPGY